MSNVIEVRTLGNEPLRKQPTISDHFVSGGCTDNVIHLSGIMKSGAGYRVFMDGKYKIKYVNRSK